MVKQPIVWRIITTSKFSCPVPNCTAVFCPLSLDPTESVAISKVDVTETCNDSEGTETEDGMVFECACEPRVVKGTIASLTNVSHLPDARND